MTNALLRHCTFAVILVVVVSAQPTPPTYTLPFYSRSFELNGMEGDHVLKEVRIAPSAYYKAHYGPIAIDDNADNDAMSSPTAAWYSEYCVNVTKPGFYLLFPVEGVVNCRAYPGYYLPLANPPSLAKFTFTKRVAITAMGGNGSAGAFPAVISGNEWGYNFGRLQFQTITKAASQNTTTTGSNNQHGMVLVAGVEYNTEIQEQIVEFLTGNEAAPFTAPNEFVPPAVCTNGGGAGHLVDRRDREAQEVDRLVFLHHMEYELARRKRAGASLDGNKSPALDGIAKMIANAGWSTERLARHYAARHMQHHSAANLVRTTAVAAADNRLFATPVRNQGACGACWAFSSVAAAEIAWYRNNTAAMMDPFNVRGSHFSVQEIIDCVHGLGENGTALIEAKGCHGGFALTALQYIVKNGISMDSSYPYQGVNGPHCLVSRVPSWARVYPLASASAIPPLRPDLMEAAVAANGAVLATIGWTDDLLSYAGASSFARASKGPQIFNNPQCRQTYAHSVTIVGFGSAPTESGSTLDYWIVKNSMGLSWGEAGYFFIAKGINMCGIEMLTFAVVFNTTNNNA